MLDDFRATMAKGDDQATVFGAMDAHNATVLSNCNVNLCVQLVFGHVERLNLGRGLTVSVNDHIWTPYAADASRLLFGLVSTRGCRTLVFFGKVEALGKKYHERIVMGDQARSWGPILLLG